MAEELTFHLEEFEGPLELLLALVSKHKMDLHNIPILELIDQYTRTVEAAQAADPDISSSFIEMAAHLVEMKSYLLLPRSTEGERMKQELTGQPMQLERDATYALNHLPQVLADCWESLMGRAPVRRMPTQAVFEPLVTAPQVSVSSRVVYILRRLIAGGAARMSQLFARSQSRSTNVATFLALLELVRGGRVTLGPKGELTMQRGRLPREKAKEEE